MNFEFGTFLQNWLPTLVIGGFFIMFMLKRSGLQKNSASIQEALQQGALVVDVRSPGEYSMGAVPGSKNIPVSDLPRRLKELEPTQSIVVCCASGGRSAMAASILKANGFNQVQDAGPWQNAMKR